MVDFERAPAGTRGPECDVDCSDRSESDGNPITSRTREEAECIRFAGTGCRGVVVVTGLFPRRGLALGPLSPGPSPEI